MSPIGSRRRRRPPANIAPTTSEAAVRKAVRAELAELTKALALPQGATATPMSSGYLQQLQQRAVMQTQGFEPLPRDPYNTIPFGPGEPLVSSPISPLLSSGRPAPRTWEYPVSWNLQTTSTREVPWSVLRDVADQVPVVRSCIDTCKAAITGLDWSFAIDSRRARALAKRSGTSSHQVIVDLQDKYADDIERLHSWWMSPNRGWTFTEWLNAVLEDELVFDAVALYPRHSLGGDLLGAEPIDASTIKPILDDRGATPVPPLVAYQQILWGWPRGDFQASPVDEIDGEYVDAVYGPLSPGGGERTDTLIYKVRNKRTRGPYGFSNVENSLPAVDLWLKRWEWLRSEFTSGVTPEMLVNVDMNMTPEQLQQWQAVFNDDLSGRSAERHRARFLPAGFSAMYPPSIDSKFSSDLDLHLMRLICASFGVLPTSLGFTPNAGIGAFGGRTAHEGEQDAELARATKPRAAWIVDLINEISVNYLGMPPEVTFTFHGIDDEDEQRAAELLEGYIGSALMTVNEGRDQLNLPRFAMAQANEPLFKTPTGPAFINPAVQPVGLPGNLPSVNTPGQATIGQDPDQTPKPQPTVTEDRDQSVHTSRQDAEAKNEQKAFLSFLDRRGRGTRDFVFKHHAPEVAEAANRLAAAGDVDAVRALFTLYDDDAAA